MAKYSIIMPVYNKERFVEKAIKSVQNQDISDWEIVAVDDESKDSSLDILNRIASEDNRVRVFSIKNKGVSNARNFALDRVEGEYITFLDADDTFNAGLFAEYDSIINQYNPDIIFTDFDAVDEDGNVLNTVTSGLSTGFYEAGQVFPILAEKQRENGFFGFISNKIVHRSIITDNKIIFDVSIKCAEDLDFYIKVYRYISNAYFSCFKSFNYVSHSENAYKTMVFDYYSQMQIHIRFKNLICDSGVLHEKGDILDQWITKEICCYIIEQLPDSRLAFYEKQKKLYENKAAMDAMTTHGLPMFKKIIILLAKAKMSTAQYMLLRAKSLIRRLVRR